MLEVKRRLPDEIVRDIKSRQFHEAEQKLLQTNNGTYKYAVHEVYNNQIGNFHLLLHFGDSIRDIESKLKIYEALYNEMEDNNHRDTAKLFRLYASIQTNILDRTDSISAQFLYNALYNSIRVEDALKVESFQDNVDIWKQKIREVWNNIDMVKLCSIVRKSYSIDLQIAFQIALFHEIELRKSIHTHNGVTLARQMKLTMEDATYNLTSSEIRSEHQDIKEKLPLSVKNLVFSSAVCIKNTYYNEYLFESKVFWNESSTRHVCTWTPGDRDEPPKFKWYVHFRESNEILLRNDYYNDYLIDSDRTRTEWKRYVFAWEKGDSVSEGVWQIEVDGDDVYLFNIHRKEYMFADLESTLNVSTRRLVYTNPDGMKTVDSKWQIVDCSDFY